MRSIKLIVSSLMVTGVIFTTGCVGKFHKGNFGNMTFEKLDKNNDGTLSKKEHLDIALHRFEMIDDNEDGKITKKELKECRSAKKMTSFKNKDLNNDGVITKGEIIEQSKSEFIKVDKNNDGVLTKSEYKKIKATYKK